MTAGVVTLELVDSVNPVEGITELEADDAVVVVCATGEVELVIESF